MKRRLNDISVNRKLQVIITIATATALLLIAAAFIAYDHFSSRRDSLEHLATVGRMVAGNSMAAVAFGDAKAAAEVLNTLDQEPDIQLGCTYDSSTHLFAEYHRTSANRCPEVVASTQHTAVPTAGTVYRQVIVLHDAPAGYIYLESDGIQMRLRRTRFAAITIVFLLGSLGAGSLLGVALRRWIAKPIVDLASVMELVANSGNYSLRAPAHGADEIGKLVSGFNRMLAEIEDTQAKLEHQAQLFRLISENAADMIAVVDIDGRRVYNSPAYQKILGYTPEELGSTSAFEQIHPEDRPLVMEAAGVAQRTGVGRRLEYRVRHKDGTWRVLESAASVIRNSKGETEKLVIVNRDITDRRQAEEALRRSEGEYRSLVERAPFGIFRTTKDGKLLAANSTLVAMLGYNSVLELTATNVREFYRDPDKRSQIVQRCWDRGQLETVEVEWKRKDGTPVVVRLNGQAGPKGTDYFEEFVENVTEWRKLEQQLRQAQKMEAVGRLAGGIAHDFNNLLGVIIGYGELLEERLGQSEALVKNAQQIIKAGQSAAALTRQLLAFSRQQVLEPKVLDLNAVVGDVEKMLRRLIGEDIELTSKLDPALGKVKVDQGQMEQVIMNLAVNARDAMPAGGKLAIETAGVTVDEKFTRRHPGMRPGSYVLLTVRDTGIGMDAETQAHIFEPFFTTKERGKGTGLGLATVYGVVKQSGGYIWVESEPGKGTTFQVYVPRIAGDISPSKPAEPSRAEQFHGSETVLVVEDAEPLRQLARQLLESTGYTVLEAATGAEAIAVAEQHGNPIHLLLTDVIMPGMDGCALATHLSPLHPEMKVLYMSGHTDRIIGVLEPGTFLLHKPFTRDALTHKVHEVLGMPPAETVS